MRQNINCIDDGGKIKILKLFAVICLMSMTSATVLAADETITLGPASISLDLGNIGFYVVEKGDVVSMDHERPRFQYEIASANIKIDASDKVVLEVHQMSTPERLDSPISRRDQATGIEHCIERSDMMPVTGDMKTEAYTIDGHQGVLATINNDPNNPLYVAAWSPDQKDGTGTIVCLIGSDLPWEMTKKIFNSVSSLGVNK
ncbi:Uncharacterised protein [uncultured archaeon]|nr:Uncharacterised protein [uncultured archaeon]